MPPQPTSDTCLESFGSSARGLRLTVLGIPGKCTVQSRSGTAGREEKVEFGLPP